jgi:alkylated DNA repair dioxygenase AlkB
VAFVVNPVSAVRTTRPLPGFEPTWPEGFAYRDDIITPGEQRALLRHIRSLPFAPFQFHGFEGKRRVVYFGWSYDFNAETARPAPPIPDFLLPLRDAAAQFAGLEGGALRQALVAEYQPDAAIGWHRDKAVFGDVIGVSLLAPCTFRLRHRVEGGWERVSLEAAPRSIYYMTGTVRTEWEHSIPPVHELRYSITFRTLRSGIADGG